MDREYEVLNKLLGWTTRRVLELLPTPQKGWTIYHYLFARRGFTPEVIRAARDNRVTLVQIAPIEDELVIL